MSVHGVGRSDRTVCRAIAAGIATVPLVLVGVPILLVGVAHAGEAYYMFEGSPETYVVPPGVMWLDVVAAGAGGGYMGGSGSLVATRVAVSPGDALIVRVGGAGGARSDGGYNGGGTGGHADDPNYEGGGGGGATDVRSGGDDLAHRIVVAGGGGGDGGSSAYYCWFVDACAQGQDGDSSDRNLNDGDSGIGAYSAGTGAGGLSAVSFADPLNCPAAGQAGRSGTLGTGGMGAESPDWSCYYYERGDFAPGGGGGGGFYGGGGGGGNYRLGGGGGGGSSYVTPAAINVAITPGGAQNSGQNGWVSITPADLPSGPTPTPPDPLTLTPSPTPTVPTDSVPSVSPSPLPTVPTDSTPSAIPSLPAVSPQPLPTAPDPGPYLTQPPGAGVPSAACDAGQQISDVTVAGIPVRLYVLDASSGQEVDICFRVGAQGGRLVVTPTAPGVGLDGLAPPSEDTNAAACSTPTPPNQMGGPHPLVGGSVAGVPVLFDAYQNGSTTWACTQVGTAVAARIIVPLSVPSASVTPGTQIAYYPDPS